MRTLRTQQAQTPCTEAIEPSRANTAELLEQLIGLTVGDVVQLSLDMSKTTSSDSAPSYFDPDHGYEVIKTTVSHDNDAQEDYFKIFLGSESITSMDDPLFKITVSAGADGQWEKCWLNIRTGTNRWGNDDYSQLSKVLQDITVVEEVDCCPECSRPL
jgi:hypothetical protein